MVYYSFVRTNQYDHVPLCHHDYVNVAVQALSDTSHNWLSLKSEERRPHGHGGLGLDLYKGRQHQVTGRVKHWDSPTFLLCL